MTEQEAKILASELESNRYWRVSAVYRCRDYSGEYGIQLRLREDPTVHTILVEPPDATLLTKLTQRREWLIELFRRSRAEAAS